MYRVSAHKFKLAAVCAAVFTVFSVAAANAATIVSTGSGSAVTTVDAAADFEDRAALNANPYTEDGLSFSRSGLSFDNNGCGFAGCSDNVGFYGGSTPFMGNYMYGKGDGTFSISTTGENVFQGLELLVGTGSATTIAQTLTWETFLNGISVGAGSIAYIGTPSWYGWTNTSGFDTLEFGMSLDAPAFDKVRAEYADTTPPVPLPASGILLVAAVSALGFARRKSLTK